MDDSTTTERRGRLYGRKWKITIYKPAYTKDENGNTVRDQEHDTAVDVSMLKCIFQTQQVYGTAASLCTLTIYNMNAKSEGDVIKEGFQIAIEGGYQEGQYGEIFTGDIVQVIRNRESGVDYKLEIIAIKGILMFDTNHVRSTIAAGSTPREIVNAVAKSADKKITVGNISNNLSNQALPRGKVLFGTPGKYYRDICRFNDAAFWAGEDDKLIIKKVIDEIPSDQVLVLTPMTGLVGTPQYGDDGIHIKILLDCRVKLQSMIKIDNELIQRQLLNIDISGKGNNNQLPQQSQFDVDGEYEVKSIVHSGDTWGDTWTTEVVGVGRNGTMGLPMPYDNDKQTME
ncbi:baseplate hub protein [Pectinatus haikarae]|uniref:Uncharacterized protein n=1 Tax=Pectinatus haikarae TaxID=349096 RepID=A0ABT9Y4J1_9FIRM|nr:hypothetical protein [Pectinatus haikarae]MDQ0202471.1 hypothetical protein [Pectinatus haikarae]